MFRVLLLLLLVVSGGCATTRVRIATTITREPIVIELEIEPV